MTSRARRVRRAAGAAGIAVGVVLGAAACDSGSAGPGGFADPCPAQPQGGALCVKVLGAHGVVDDVIGYLSSTESPLAGRRWRLILSTYGCDPGTGTPPACAPERSYPTAARHGTPPIERSCRRADGTAETASPGCHDTLAAAYASHGDWSGFSVPSTVRHETWFCVSEEVAVHGRWVAPAPALLPAPVRACAAMRPA